MTEWLIADWEGLVTDWEGLMTSPVEQLRHMDVTSEARLYQYCWAHEGYKQSEFFKYYLSVNQSLFIYFCFDVASEKGVDI